jgi:cytochrome b involved in lipid metabolism
MKREDIHLSDKYVILEDGVYDMERFQAVHPGGDVVMFFTGQVGMAITPGQ